MSGLHRRRRKTIQWAICLLLISVPTGARADFANVLHRWGDTPDHAVTARIVYNPSTMAVIGIENLEGGVNYTMIQGMLSINSYENDLAPGA